jgi:predicted metal-dependent phosphoesterase TrpH
VQFKLSHYQQAGCEIVQEKEQGMMAGYFIDLHTHSLVSDGTDTPTQLVYKAAREGLVALALTDHDALEGLPEAEEVAMQQGLRFIRGCELAIQEPDLGELHILGLWVPHAVPALDKALEEARDYRKERNRKILERLDLLGMHLVMENVLEFAKGVSPGRPHIAQAMLAKGYVSSFKEAFDLYIGEDGSAFVPRTLITPQEGIELLAGHGATVSLAHPFLRDSISVGQLDRLLPDLKAWGLTAIEAYHSAHDATQVRQCIDLADKYGLLITGGSDYHGRAKPDVLLGVCGSAMRVPVCVLEKLEEDRRKRGLWV